MQHVISESSCGIDDQPAEGEARNIDSINQFSTSVSVEDDYGDDSMEEDSPLANIPNSISRTSTAGSSLSGEEDAIPMDETTPFDTPPNSPLDIISERMNRSDSRSSHDSSVRNSLNGGNWGWFEDVHSGGDVMSGDAKKKASNKRKNNGLMPEFGFRLINIMGNVTGVPSSSEGECTFLFYYP
jgi:hypothetical protein